MFVTILFWAVLITFLWWELLQLKKIRQEMEELPSKSTEALKFMEDTGVVSKELKEEIVPMIMGAASDLKIASDDMRTSVNTILKAQKEVPPWVNQLVTAIDIKLEKSVSKIEKAIQELRKW